MIDGSKNIFIVFWFLRKWPLHGIDRFQICFPKVVKKFEVGVSVRVDDGHVLVIVFGIKIKVSGCGNGILRVGLPNSIFELDDRVSNHESDGHIHDYLHLILKPHEYLAAICSFLFA
jgi:hypothetical protein